MLLKLKALHLEYFEIAFNAKIITVSTIYSYNMPQR
jgi:hypothetical protein